MSREECSQLCETMRICGILISEKRKPFVDDTSTYKFDKASLGSLKKVSSRGEIVSKVINIAKKKENEEEAQDDFQEEPTNADVPVASTPPVAKLVFASSTTQQSATSTSASPTTTGTPDATPAVSRQHHQHQIQQKQQHQLQQIHNLWKNPHITQASLVFDPTTVPDTPEYNPTNWEDLEKAIFEYEDSLQLI